MYLQSLQTPVRTPCHCRKFVSVGDHLLPPEPEIKQI